METHARSVQLLPDRVRKDPDFALHVSCSACKMLRGARLFDPAYFMPRHILLPFENAGLSNQPVAVACAMICETLTEKTAIELFSMLEIQPALGLELV